MSDQDFLNANAAPPESARAIGFEDYRPGELPAVLGWKSPSGCAGSSFRIIETGERYPGFGLKALAASSNSGCGVLAFYPFVLNANQQGMFRVEWDFTTQDHADSWLRVGFQNDMAAAIEFHSGKNGLETLSADGGALALAPGKNGSRPGIHHAILQIETSEEASRITRYVDGQRVDDFIRADADLATFAKSFQIEIGGGSTPWVLDNFQFLAAPALQAPLASTAVSPDQMNGWAAATETPNGQISFVPGPGTPPAGSGSAQFTVDTTGGMILYTLAYGGRRLDQVRTLSYSTYRTGSGPQAVSLQFDVDYDVADSNFAWSGRLVYEPYFTETVLPGTWQTWDPRAGKWWATRAPGNATCPQSAPCTWADLLNAYPNAGILAYGALYFKAGSGWTGGYQWNLDDFKIGFNPDANDTEWDFEPEVPCTATCYVDGVNGSDLYGGASPSRAKQTVQAAINQVAPGGNVIVYPATYRENLHVTKPLDLGGTDKNTVIIQPLLSNPNPCSDSSLCGCPVTSSNVILVEASNATVHDLTVDGDNTLDNSGINVGGANIDARNGIVENYCVSPFVNTVVHDTIVRNIFLRGIQSSENSTFSFHHNNVSNVQGSESSIAIFSRMGSGSMFNNTVSGASDAISSNWSKGIQFLNNTVTGSASGIHSDNSHGAGGGAADLISDNTVSAGTSNSYGIWAFVPYTDVTIRNNTITNVDVGLGAFASQGGETILRENTVSGAGTAGAYLSTTTFYFGEMNGSASMTGNTISNFQTGVLLEANPGFTLTAAANCNSIAGNTSEGAMTTGSGSFVLDFTRNWWGDPTGPLHSTNPSGLGNQIVGPVPFSPWSQDTFPSCSLLAGIPTRLAFQVQPSTTPMNAPITPAVQVRAEDNSGNLGINFTGAVNMAFGANPTAAALGGTLSQTAVSGVATFNDLTVSKMGNGYSLVATTAAGLTGAISAPFNVGFPIPTITGLVPDHRGLGSPAFILTVNGTGFFDLGVSTVYWNGNPKTTTYVSGTQLTASIPASDLLVAGPVSITVVNSAPGGGTSNSMTFTIRTLPPEVWVNDDWTGTPYGVDPDGAGPATEFGYDAFAAVQAGVNGVATGGLVHVLNGIYEEQVDIGRSMSVSGESRTGTIIRSPLTLATKFGASNKPIVYAHGSESIHIETLRVDGAGRANGNYRVMGIAYYNSGGQILDCDILDVRETPLSGNPNGVGVYALVDDAQSHNLTVQGNNISGYEKNGMALNGAGLNATVTGNTVMGAGSLSIIAQNGIQVGFGGIGTINNNTVSGNFCSGNVDCDADPTSAANADGAAGILLYGPGTSSITISGNTLTDNQYSVWTVGAADVAISGNAMTGPGTAGVAVWDCDQWCDDLGVLSAGTTGTVNTNTIGAFQYGVLYRNYLPDPAEPSVITNNNRFHGNTPFGAWSDTAATLNAECNYWNHPSGPTHPGNAGGTGDPSSDHLDYSPWNQNDDTGCSTPGAVPTRLVFTVQPSNSTVSVPISPAMQVEAQDAAGNPGINYNGAVTLSLSANPGGATLAGTTTQNAVAGTAVFSDINLNAVGTGYELTATATGLVSTISAPFDITCPTVTLDDTLPVALKLVNYHGTITASGGTAPYSYTISTGTLPPGLTLNSDGTITGAPTAIGTFDFEVTATDAGNCTGSRSYSITVLCGPLPIFPESLPDATVGVAYNQTIVAAGGTPPYVFTITGGSLPAGLTLNPDGTLTGAPTVFGTFNFVVTVTDAEGCVDARSYSLNVQCGTIALSPATLPDVPVQSNYDQTLTASGGTAPYTFTVTAGQLPPGILLSLDGHLTGSPNSPGSFSFSVTATDANNCTGAQSYSIATTCLFCDDFEDGVVDPRWLVIKPNWTEDGHNLVGTPAGRKAVTAATPIFSGCDLCYVEATVSTPGGVGGKVWLLAWYVNKRNTIELMMMEDRDKWLLKERVNGRVAGKAKAFLTIDPNVFYRARITFDGTTFQLTIDGSPVLSLPATVPHNGSVGFQVKNTTALFGEIVVN